LHLARLSRGWRAGHDRPIDVRLKQIYPFSGRSKGFSRFLEKGQ
jgi:hypothetical protein